MSEDGSLLLEYIRSVGTWFAVAFVTFVVFPVEYLTAVALLPFDRDRKAVHHVVRFWTKAILFLAPLMQVTVEGAHHLRRNTTYVFIANHQSHADVLAVLHLSHPFKFIAKKELFWIPIFGWTLFVAGYIPLARGDQRSSKEAARKAREYLERGASVLFFPEGTRSRDGEIHDFKVGAFKLAAELEIPVVPIVINGTGNLLPKGKRTFGSTVKVTVKIGKPHQAAGTSPLEIESFCERIRSEMIQSLRHMRGDEGKSQNRPSLVKS